MAVLRGCAHFATPQQGTPPWTTFRAACHSLSSLPMRGKYIVVWNGKERSWPMHSLPMLGFSTVVCAGSRNVLKWSFVSAIWPMPTPMSNTSMPLPIPKLSPLTFALPRGSCPWSGTSEERGIHCRRACHQQSTIRTHRTRLTLMKVDNTRHGVFYHRIQLLREAHAGISVCASRSFCKRMKKREDAELVFTACKTLTINLLTKPIS